RKRHYVFHFGQRFVDVLSQKPKLLIALIGGDCLELVSSSKFAESWVFLQARSSRHRPRPFPTSGKRWLRSTSWHCAFLDPPWIRETGCAYRGIESRCREHGPASSP